MNIRHLQKWKNTKKYLWSIKGLLLVLGILFLWWKDVSIQIGMKDIAQTPKTATQAQDFAAEETTTLAKNVSHFLASKAQPKAAPNTSKESSNISSNLANTYSNLTYSDPNLGSKSGVDSRARAAKRKKQRAYVDRFANAAVKEMEKYGIPASITLAQGLIESNCGESRLASSNNNHFGIKCFSRTCKKGHCSNFTDDTHKDFFRIYKSPWESYRSHSILLQKNRYKALYKLSKTDYKGWAKGLKKAGYATDPLYANKLINLIQDLKLYEYDR
ncbi:MAG: glucosaminidase domain-containing protein [Bacteroidota bacterium]